MTVSYNVELCDMAKARSVTDAAFSKLYDRALLAGKVSGTSVNEKDAATYWAETARNIREYAEYAAGVGGAITTHSVTQARKELDALKAALEQAAGHGEPVESLDDDVKAQHEALA